MDFLIDFAPFRVGGKQKLIKNVYLNKGPMRMISKNFCGYKKT